MKRMIWIATVLLLQLSAAAPLFAADTSPDGDGGNASSQRAWKMAVCQEESAQCIRKMKQSGADAGHICGPAYHSCLVRAGLAEDLPGRVFGIPSGRR